MIRNIGRVAGMVAKVFSDPVVIAHFDAIGEVIDEVANEYALEDGDGMAPALEKGSEHGPDSD